MNLYSSIYCYESHYYYYYYFFQESAGEDIPIMLLGNKTDKEMERQVQQEVGQRLAKVCSVFIH